LTISTKRRQRRTNDVNVNLFLSHFKDLKWRDVSTSLMKMGNPENPEADLSDSPEIAGGFATAVGRGVEDERTHPKKRK